jgi:hypothetical protein
MKPQNRSATRPRTASTTTAARHPAARYVVNIRIRPPRRPSTRDRPTGPRVHPPHTGRPIPRCQHAAERALFGAGPAVVTPDRGALGGLSKMMDRCIHAHVRNDPRSSATGAVVVPAGLDPPPPPPPLAPTGFTNGNSASTGTELDLAVDPPPAGEGNARRLALPRQTARLTFDLRTGAAQIER